VPPDFRAFSSSRAKEPRGLATEAALFVTSAVTLPPVLRQLTVHQTTHEREANLRDAKNRSRRFDDRQGLLAFVCVLMLVGCSSPPPPRTLYQDPTTLIRLHVDERTPPVHTHPAQISTEQIAEVLRGIRVVARKGVMWSMVLGEPQANPAFSPVEIQTLAPKLSRALAQAKPDELVTFYHRVSDASLGLGITSGGLFVQDDHLYFVLANNRTMPSEGMSENRVHEIDPIDSPLLPISRSSFRVAFAPATAAVPSDEWHDWPYVDQGRIVVIDLPQLARDIKSPSAASNR
jgi:hypothetical protein